MTNKNRSISRQHSTTPSWINPPFSSATAQTNVNADGLPSSKELKLEGAVAQILKGSQTQLNTISANYNTSLYRELARVYAVSLFLAEDVDAWTDFTRMPEWENFRGEKPQPKNRHLALKFAFRVAVGFEGTEATKRASKYFKMLEPSFNQNIPADEIAGLIEKTGGIEAMLKANKSGPPDESIYLRLKPDAKSHRLLDRNVDQRFVLKVAVDSIRGNVIDAEIKTINPVRQRPR